MTSRKEITIVLLMVFALGLELGFALAKSKYECHSVGGISAAYAENKTGNGMVTTDSGVYRICK